MSKTVGHVPFNLTSIMSLALLCTSLCLFRLRRFLPRSILPVEFEGFDMRPHYRPFDEARASGGLSFRIVFRIVTMSGCECKPDRNGSIPTGESSEFNFTAKNPAQEGKLFFRAIQIHEDGTKSESTGAEGTRSPSPSVDAKRPAGQ